MTQIDKVGWYGLNELNISDKEPDRRGSNGHSRMLTRKNQRNILHVQYKCSSMNEGTNKGQRGAKPSNVPGHKCKARGKPLCQPLNLRAQGVLRQPTGIAQGRPLKPDQQGEHQMSKMIANQPHPELDTANHGQTSSSTHKSITMYSDQCAGPYQRLASKERNQPWSNTDHMSPGVTWHPKARRPSPGIPQKAI